MINQVSMQNANNNFLHADFDKNKNRYLFVSKDEMKQIQDGQKPDSHKLGMSIVTTSLVAGAGILLLMRGLPKGITKNLMALRQKIGYKISEIDEKTKISKTEKIYRFILQRTSSFAEKLEACNNITSLKDILFKKLMSKTKFTKNIHDKISNLFEKISRKTVLQNYKNTDKTVNSTLSNLQQVNKKILEDNPLEIVTINGISKTKKEWIEVINNHSAQIQQLYKDNFGEQALLNRYQRSKQAVKGLDEKFWQESFQDWHNFTSKKMYQTFVAYDLIKGNRTALIRDVNKFRKLISNDITDTYKSLSHALTSLENTVSPKDETSIRALKRLKINLEKYINLSGSTEEAQRTAISQKILTDLDNIKSVVNSNTKKEYPPEIQELISRHIETATNTLNNDSKGNVQEIITIYKNLLERNEYNKVKASMNSMVNSLDNSINTETARFFDKLRDLTIGSAPTDIMSILAGVGTLGYGLTKAKDNDQRVSISLKYGIPALATIGTSLYCTAGLLSGGKAMAFAFISGFIVNKIGVFVDDMRKKYLPDLFTQKQ